MNGSDSDKYSAWHSLWMTSFVTGSGKDVRPLALARPRNYNGRIGPKYLCLHGFFFNDFDILLAMKTGMYNIKIVEKARKT